MKDIEKIKIYGFDDLGYFTGLVGLTNKYLGLPKGFTYAEVGDIPDGFYARFEGGTWKYVEEKEEIKNVPARISQRQARLYLLKLGLLDTLEESLKTNRAYQVEWEYANEILRDFPLVSRLGELMGLSSEQIDDMFIEASKI